MCRAVAPAKMRRSDRWPAKEGAIQLGALLTAAAAGADGVHRRAERAL